MLKVTEKCKGASGGFEPPTNRFVASTLSSGQENILLLILCHYKAISIKNSASEEDYSPCSSPFRPLPKQRYHLVLLQLIRYLFDPFIAEDFGEIYGASGGFELLKPSGS